MEGSGPQYELSKLGALFLPILHFESSQSHKSSSSSFAYFADSIRDSSNMLRRRPYRSNTCTPSSFSMMSKQQVAFSQMAW